MAEDLNLVFASFSFLAGVGSFFSPCSVALIPAYIGYYLGSRDEALNIQERILRGLKAGILAGFGLISVFTLAGVIFSIFTNVLKSISFYLGIGTGAFLIFLGILMIANRNLGITLPLGFVKVNPDRLRNFYLFGVVYALGSLGCSLPIFLLVVFQALNTASFLGAFFNFLVYSLTISGLMIGFSILAAISKGTVALFFHKFLGAIKTLGALTMIAAGSYIIYFQVKSL